MVHFKVISLSFFALIISSTLWAQDVGAPTRVSQSRTTIANIGKADITIKYHSPSVHGRKIFGGLVPYNFVVDGKEYPWRAGSNDRTLISFSHDVSVEGHPLKAGEYGFIVLVSEEEWVLIFSSGKTWGSFSYDQANDVLRIPVKTERVPFQEWLSYAFANPGSESVDVVLSWEETAVRFKVTTDATANIIAELEGKEEKAANDYQELAIRTLEQDPNARDRALQYLETSKSLLDEADEGQFKTHYLLMYKFLKGDLLKRMHKEKQGQALIDDALKNTTGFPIYYYALNKYINEGKKKEGLELLRNDLKIHPDNYATYLALGEIEQKEGDQQAALENFKKAYELSEQQNSMGVNYTRYLYLQNKLMLESNY